MPHLGGKGETPTQCTPSSLPSISSPDSPNSTDNRRQCESRAMGVCYPSGSSPFPFPLIWRLYYQLLMLSVPLPCRDEERTCYQPVILIGLTPRILGLFSNCGVPSFTKKFQTWSSGERRNDLAEWELVPPGALHVPSCWQTAMPPPNTESISASSLFGWALEGAQAWQNLQMGYLCHSHFLRRPC